MSYTAWFSLILFAVEQPYQHLLNCQKPADLVNIFSGWDQLMASTAMAATQPLWGHVQ
jgi:hypothetical protein